jgi:hypothetical protein
MKKITILIDERKMGEFLNTLRIMDCAEFKIEDTQTGARKPRKDKGLKRKSEGEPT